MTKSVDIIYGIHAVQAALTHALPRLLTLLVDKSSANPRCQALIALAKAQGIALEYWPRRRCDEISQGGLHQGVILKARPEKPYEQKDLAGLIDKCQQAPLVLILDGVCDPHNLGACLRTCDGAGVDFVIAPKHSASNLTSVVHKVAAGASFTVPYVRVVNIARALQECKQLGLWLTGMRAGQEKTLYDIDLKVPTGLVLGAEGDGLRPLTEKHCDQLASLPMAGFVASLNVSVASAVCLYEAQRQRKNNMAC